MPSAVCPFCDEPAFSSAPFDKAWVCPTCGETVYPKTPVAPQKGTHRRMKTAIEKYTKFWLTTEP